MTYRIHRTKNGWLVTTKAHVFTDDLAECHVFETMRRAAAYLVKQAGEDLRDDKGHFISTKP